MFDADLKRAHRDGAARILRSAAAASSDSDLDFECIHRSVAHQLVDRLRDIQKEFEAAADVGCHSGHVFQALHDDGIAEEIGLTQFRQIDASPELLRLAENRTRALGDALGVRMSYGAAAMAEAYPEHAAPEEHDLILSSLALHWENDIPAVLGE